MNSHIICSIVVSEILKYAGIDILDFKAEISRY